jgi:undecaprenyl-diphosphatase
MHNILLSGILNQNITVFYLINTGMDNNVFDFLMPLITNFGSVIAWAVVCGLLFLFGGEKGKKVALLGLAALFISNVAVYLLKFVIAEPRPFLTLPNVDLLVYENEIYSFPSGHTASSFAAAVVIGLSYKLNLKNRNYRLIYPLLAFAAVIGFSRIYVGVHYPLDVIFGAVVGILSGLLILKMGNSRLVNKMSQVCLKDNYTR